MGKIQENPVREDEKWKRIPLRENEQQWRGRELEVHGRFCTVVGRVECLRERITVVFFAIVKSIVGGVCVWVRTDSPATPLPKTITTSTTSNHS